MHSLFLAILLSLSANAGSSLDPGLEGTWVSDWCTSDNGGKSHRTVLRIRDGALFTLQRGFSHDYCVGAVADGDEHPMPISSIRKENANTFLITSSFREEQGAPAWSMVFRLQNQGDSLVRDVLWIQVSGIKYYSTPEVPEAYSKEDL